MLKLLPLILAVALAILSEPIRSSFSIEIQSCEYLPTSTQFSATFFNAKHIIGYGVICLIALFTFQHRTVWFPIVGVFIFSITMEYLQSFFTTGHCRAWDLIPNAIGIGIAVFIFWFARRAAFKNPTPQ